MAPGQTTQVARLRSSFDPPIQRCIRRRALQGLHLPGQPACAPQIQLTLSRR